ncbi:hypothetical protein ACOJBM_38685 [Rhizobium beringeri]
MTIAVGEPFARKALLKKVEGLGLVLQSIFSPDAFISEYAEIADGVIVAPHVSIQATAKIGRNVAVNTASILGHDVVVEENCVVSSMVNLGRRHASRDVELSGHGRTRQGTHANRTLFDYRHGLSRAYRHSR